MSNNQNIALAFKALGSEHRLQLFEKLAACCQPGTVCDTTSTACVGDLAAVLSLAPSTVSHHIKELRQAGLIKTERNGQTVACWVDPEMLNTLRAFLSRLDGEQASQTQTC